MNAITNDEEFAAELARLSEGTPEDDAAALLQAIADALRAEQPSEPAGSTH